MSRSKILLISLLLVIGKFRTNCCKKVNSFNDFYNMHCTAGVIANTLCKALSEYFSVFEKNSNVLKIKVDDHVLVMTGGMIQFKQSWVKSIKFRWHFASLCFFESTVSRGFLTSFFIKIHLYWLHLDHSKFVIPTLPNHHFCLISLADWSIPLLSGGVKC